MKKYLDQVLNDNFSISLKILLVSFWFQIFLGLLHVNVVAIMVFPREKGIGAIWDSKASPICR
jgi:hypothetical protein